MKRLIVGMSGASGVIYGIRLLEVLRDVAGVETHLVMSQAARRTALLETDYRPDAIEALADAVYPFKDIGAAISSGSFKTAGMVVLPCSIKTLAGIDGEIAMGNMLFEGSGANFVAAFRERIHHILEVNGARYDGVRNQGHAQKNRRISFNIMQPYPEGELKGLFPTIVIRP